MALNEDNLAGPALMLLTRSELHGSHPGVTMTRPASSRRGQEAPLERPLCWWPPPSAVLPGLSSHLLTPPSGIVVVLRLRADGGSAEAVVK